MCRSSTDSCGPRRCNEQNAYGRAIRNLQAKKQYHAKKGNEAKVREIAGYIANLREDKRELLADGGILKPYEMTLTPNAEKVLNQLRDSGFIPYVVGGSVRDALLGLDSKDVDIEVYGATADQVLKSLKKLGPVDAVGKSFGILKIRLDDEDFDVSLPRRDSKTGEGHRGFEVEVDPLMSLTKATARRDFTINALLYDNKNGFIIDKHGGLEDLQQGYLRHVSDAFDEDPLRVLRGVQMASRFSMTMHPDTVKKAQTLKDQFNQLAVERVQVEFEKLYTKGKSPHKAIQLLQDTGWADNFAGLRNANLTDMKRDLKRAQSLIDNGTVQKNKAQLLMTSVIASKMDDNEAKGFVRYTTIGDKMKNGAYNLSRLTPPTKLGRAHIRRWAKNMPNDITISDWTSLAKAQGQEKIANSIERRAAKIGVLHGPEQDLLNGNDLLTLFKGSKAGPWMKAALENIRSAQYADAFRDKAKGLDWAAKNIHPPA